MGLSRAPIKALPDREELLRLFEYDPNAGALRWKSIPVNFRRAKVGDEVGTVNARGYRVVGIAGVYYYVHRIIWKMVTGDEPSQFIDHIDRDRLNNRWLNFREATNAENKQNGCIYSNNKTGVKGVCWDASHRAWRAYISVNGVQRKLGRFKALEAATAAVNAARLQLHGNFAHF